MANQDLEKLATLTFFGLSDALKGALSVQDNLIAGSFPTLEIQVKDREEVPHFFGGINGEPRYLTEDDKRKLNSLFENGGLLFASAKCVALRAGCASRDDGVFRLSGPITGTRL